MRRGFAVASPQLARREAGAACLCRGAGKATTDEHSGFDLRVEAADGVVYPRVQQGARWASQRVHAGSREAGEGDFRDYSLQETVTRLRTDMARDFAAGAGHVPPAAAGGETGADVGAATYTPRRAINNYLRVPGSWLRPSRSCPLSCCRRDPVCTPRRMWCRLSAVRRSAPELSFTRARKDLETARLEGHQLSLSPKHADDMRFVRPLHMRKVRGRHGTVVPFCGELSYSPAAPASKHQSEALSHDHLS